MSKRNAIRTGMDPHRAESVAYTVQRYGPIKPETLKELLEYLERPEVKAERVYTVYEETIGSVESGIELMTFPVIKTNMIGSPIEKYLDNEHDAQNTLANIRNKDFPKNKHGQ